MGVKFGAADSSNLISAMRNNITIVNAIIDRLAAGSLHLIGQLEVGVLQGAAFTAGRGLFGELIIPGIIKLRQAVDDIQAELASYEHAHTVVAPFGDLAHDDLAQALKDTEEQLRLVEEQIEKNKDFLTQVQAIFTGDVGSLASQNQALEKLKEHLDGVISQLKDKIGKLEWFVADVSNYFSDSVEVMRLAARAAIELNKVAVEADGSYYTNGVNLALLQQLRDAKISTHTHPADIPEGGVVYDTLAFDSYFSYDKLMVWLSSGAADELRALALSNPGLFDSMLQEGMKFKGEGNPWGLLGILALAPFWSAQENGVALGGGLLFSQKFVTDGEWDMKTYLAEEHGYSRGYFYLHDEQGRVVRSDAFGNAMYGYMLAYWGVSVETALKAANSNDLGGVDTGITGDDLDDRAVEFGYLLYKKYPNGFTPEQYSQEMANAKLTQ